MDALRYNPHLIPENYKKLKLLMKNYFMINNSFEEDNAKEITTGNNLLG